ncbi:glycosyltransferase [uncultured Desulfovibrio sp.]|uniref:glycosyltransferase n=1 Tax=uncultured Desulfovibrio sp. TaxID=167968 RepID=UPI00272CE787|nr:glycosyltransferase [uncultured Desulfovibrio sp.]
MLVPFFSVITSTYNAAATLPRLLDSLSAQTCRDFNWIVQDGASTDATMEIVERYRPRLPAVLAESVKDNGIYTAWNRALDRAGEQLGQWVLFLGGDDLLAADDTLERVQQFLLRQPEHLLFCCGHLEEFYDDPMHGHKIFFDLNFALRRMKYGMSFLHPALFHAQKLFYTERFSEKYAISSDYEFLLRMRSHRKDYIVFDGFVTKMSQFGISQTNKKKADFESDLIRKQYFPFFYHIINFFWWMKAQLGKTTLGGLLWKKVSAMRATAVRRLDKILNRS